MCLISVLSQDDKMLTDRLKSICDSLVVNNRNTSNFKTLIRLLLEKVDFEKLEAEEKYVYLLLQLFLLWQLTLLNYAPKSRLIVISLLTAIYCGGKYLMDCSLLDIFLNTLFKTQKKSSLSTNLSYKLVCIQFIDKTFNNKFIWVSQISRQ